MIGNSPPVQAYPPEEVGRSLRPWVARAVDGRRLAAAGLVAFVLSLGPLFNAGLFDFFSPAEVAVAWLEHLLELAVVAAVLLSVFTLLDEILPRQMRLRLAVVCTALLCVSAVLALLLYAYYARGFEHLPPPLRLLADSMRWGLPAVFLALIADVHQRAMQADSAAAAAESARAHDRQGESEQQLALLQAQTEPHFLFNVLGNVRRLYSTQPQAGAAAVDSLMRYLRTALPQVRNRSGSLGDEVELARAYLELFQVRMGTRLTFRVEADPPLRQAEFPPMLLMILVENAIKHGVEPAGRGHVLVRARRHGETLEVAVHDDGPGFATAASDGTGVGLANLRRQLAARYGDSARLTLEGRLPRGASATLAIPWRSAPADKGREAAVAPERPAGAPAIRAPDFPASRQAPSPGLVRWLRTHRGSVTIAGILSLGAPLTFLAGSLSVMRDPLSANWPVLGFWWTLYGLESWLLFLFVGYACLRLLPSVRARGRGAVWLLCAAAAAALVSLTTAGRADALIEQGVVQSAVVMHLYSFTFSLTMALLFFAHLQRSRSHEAAAARLVQAQSAQREARSRITQARLQAVQARIDPRLLFEMLDAVRRLYRCDAVRAQRLLDELIAFLRLALPRLRNAASNIPRELELARIHTRLRNLAGATGAEMTADVSGDALHARFPPGVVLPLLDDALRRSPGPCSLSAERAGNDCRLVLSTPQSPSTEIVGRVRALLAEVYGATADLQVAAGEDRIMTLVRVPYELA